jgi:branched-chain amino acid transport system permease protein
MTRRALARLCFALVAGLAVVTAPALAAASSGQSPTTTSPPLEQPPTTAAAPGESPADTGGTTGTDAGGTSGPRVVATLTVGEDGDPLEGVDMVVSADGEEIGRSSSDEDGKVAVELPGAGTYEVSIDTSTLPEGVTFEEGARTSLTPTVQASGDRPLIFRLVAEGQSASGGSSDVERIASLLASGIRFGLVIALAAVGLSLIFGTTGLTNFAHGELLTFGAMAAWYLNAENGGLGLPLVIAGLGGIVAAALFGASFELGVYRPLRRRGMPVVSQMVVSIGLAFGLRYLFSIIYGPGSQQYSQYAAQAPTIELGPVSLRPKDLVVSIIAVVALVAIGLFLQRARLGTAIRAVSDNHDLSVASGIDERRVILMVWILSGAMAGLAGIMLGSTDNVQWTMGQRVLLIMFAAVLLGGLGTTFGAMFGGLFVGIVSDLSTFWLDADLKIVVALATLVAVLLIRPQGVFGVRARTA